MTVSTTPAPARTDRATTASAAVPQTDPAARTRGSRPLAALLLAAPLLLAGGVVLHPDDTHGVEHTLDAVGGSQQLLWSAIHLLEPAAWMLIGITLLFALPRMASDRGRRLLTTAAVFAAIGFSSIALLVYSHGEAFLFMAATDVPASTYEPLFEQYETGFPLAALPSLLGRVGLLLAAIGLIRARTVPVWAAALLLVPAFALGSTGGLPLAIGIPALFGPLVVAVAVIARRVAATGGPALHTGR